MPELNEDPVPDVSSYQVKYTERVIQHALGVMAYHIGLATRRYSHLYVVIILDGALYVGADLTRHLHPNVTIGFVKASSYGDGRESEAEGGLHVEFIGDVKSWNLREQAVLLIDDIYDTGNTMEKISVLFKELGAKTVYTAVLIHREKDDADEFDSRKPNFSAFQVKGDEFFVGYGLDDKRRARNMRSVYTIPPLEFEEESK